jgi:hypothetical protein
MLLAHDRSMEKFKLLLLTLLVIVATVLAVAKVLIVEVEDFWRFLHQLPW